MTITVAVMVVTVAAMADTTTVDTTTMEAMVSVLSSDMFVQGSFAIHFYYHLVLI